MSATRVIGVRTRTAYALSVIGLPVVHRSTIRALLPPGRVRDIGVTGHLRAKERGGTGRKNVVSGKFQDALAAFERDGWIIRGREFIAVKCPGDLLDYAMEGVGSGEQILLSIDVALDRIKSDLVDEGQLARSYVDQRHRELLALKRLMEQGFGSANWSGRGSVRLLPRGGVL